MLAPSDESSPLLDECFERLGGEELQVHVPIVAEEDGQPIFAKFGKAELI